MKSVESKLSKQIKNDDVFKSMTRLVFFLNSIEDTDRGISLPSNLYYELKDTLGKIHYEKHKFGVEFLKAANMSKMYDKEIYSEVIDESDNIFTNMVGNDKSFKKLITNDSFNLPTIINYIKGDVTDEDLVAQMEEQEAQTTNADEQILLNKPEKTTTCEVLIQDTRWRY